MSQSTSYEDIQNSSESESPNPVVNNETTEKVVTNTETSNDKKEKKKSFSSKKIISDVLEKKQDSCTEVEMKYVRLHNMKINIDILLKNAKNELLKEAKKSKKKERKQRQKTTPKKPRKAVGIQAPYPLSQTNLSLLKEIYNEISPEKIKKMKPIQNFEEKNFLITPLQLTGIFMKFSEDVLKKEKNVDLKSESLLRTFLSNYLEAIKEGDISDNYMPNENAMKYLKEEEDLSEVPRHSLCSIMCSFLKYESK